MATNWRILALAQPASGSTSGAVCALLAERGDCEILLFMECAYYQLPNKRRPNMQTTKQTNNRTHKHTNKQTNKRNKQPNKQPNKHLNPQTNEQPNKQTINRTWLVGLGWDECLRNHLLWAREADDMRTPKQNLSQSICDVASRRALCCPGADSEHGGLFQARFEACRFMLFQAREWKIHKMHCCASLYIFKEIRETHACLDFTAWDTNRPPLDLGDTKYDFSEKTVLGETAIPDQAISI